jgi:hypothetical protein
MPSVTDQIEANSDRSCHFERGRKSEVAVVLSCPGRKEEKSIRPASGTTGKNLDLLLAKLGPLVGIPDLARSDVTVTNAFTGVEYKARAGRSEASFAEVRQNDNISRLNAELADISDLVIFCGDRASAVAERVTLHAGAKLVRIPHLGMQGVNQITSDMDGAPILSVADSKIGGDKRSAKKIGRANTSRRIDVLVQRILDQTK